MAEISEVFNHPGAGFVTLPKGIKFPPPYKGWQLPENARTFQQAQDHAAKGGNVGILAGGGYIGLDKDNPVAFDGLELPTTTTWETRPGRYGLRFKASDDIAAALATYGKKPDLAQVHLYKDGQHVGEIKLQCAYQIIPPSWKTLEDGARADYRLLDSSQPAPITLAKLLADLQAIGITFSEKQKESRLDANYNKLEDMGRKAHQRRAESDEDRNRRYAEAALRNEVLIMAGTTEPGRNKQLNDSAWNMGQIVAVGVLSEAEVITELTKAAENTGLPIEEIRKTIMSGLEAGKLHPRQIPEQPKSNMGKSTEESYNEVLEEIKANPRHAGNTEVLTRLAMLKIDDAIGFDLFISNIKKAKIGIKVDTITGLVNAYVEKIKAANLYQPKDIEHDPDTISAARAILEHGDPMQAHLEYVEGKVRGGEKPARLVTLSSYSAYLSNNDRLPADIVGSPQSGKSTITAVVLEGFPEENVIFASEASPKSLYYLAQQQPERLKDCIAYIDDARQEHIPVLKTFRNEGNVRPTNLTVSDGEFLELVVQYRPVVLASSVTPLRDLEGQATSRAFLVSVPDATPEEEETVRAKIRQQVETGALLSQKNDSRQKTLQEMVRILRDEGIRDVVIPFDVEEPQGADRRGTGQFIRLIKVAAFINQFQRPIIELDDGRKFVLATYADFETAAHVWFDFAEGQEFKISSKVLDVLKFLPDQWPGKSAPTIAKDMGKSQRTTERYLEDLYESGIASREKIAAPGMPYGYWVDQETRQKVLAQIPEDSDTKTNSVRITTENLCREYVAKNSPDSLKDSYINFFTNSDIEIKKMYKGNKVSIELIDGLGWVSSYTTLFSQKSCRDSKKVAQHSETITTNDLSQILTGLPDSDLKMSQIPDNLSLIPTMSKIDRPTPTTNEKVRIVAKDGYRTQIQEPGNPQKWVNHLFDCGEIIEVQHWKATDLITKGIAEAT